MRYTVNIQKNYPTNNINYNHIDEIWTFHLADMKDYKIPNNKGFSYIFVVIDKFSKFVWVIPFKNEISQTFPQEFSNTLTKSKRSTLKLESDRGSEWYNSVFQNFLNLNVI